MAKQPVKSTKAEVFHRLKVQLPRQALSLVDVTRFARMSEDAVRTELRSLISRLCTLQSIQLAADEHDILVQEVMHELYGFGPLEPLLKDPDISDILVNGADHVYVERDGVLHATDVNFPDNEYLLNYVKRLVNRMDRRIDESQPMVDVSLPDGSRLNAVIPPLALRGPTLSIRRFRSNPMMLEDLVEMGSLTPDMADFLVKAVQARTNLLISGGTGSGKTTLLNSLSRFISQSERVITIEHTAELQLQQPDVVSLEAKLANIEGKGEISVRDLLKNSLRMRPDRIIVGECRGSEVFDVLQAMISGHDGSMTTIHASDTREALHRLEMMIALSGIDLPKRASRQYVSSSVQLLVHLKRLNSGERRVVRISELSGVHEDEYKLDDVFHYQQRGADRYGRAIGSFHATGHKPVLLERMESLGIECPAEMFSQRELLLQRA